MSGRTVDSQVAQGGARSPLDLEIGVLEQEQDGLEGVTVDFADICVLLARYDGGGGGSEGCIPRSVISAKVKLAERCRSMLSE